MQIIRSHNYIIGLAIFMGYLSEGGTAKLVILVIGALLTGTVLCQEDEEIDQWEVKVGVEVGLRIASMVVNSLKRVLVLSAMLFLIENMVNFWILASSYAFLRVDMPSNLHAILKSIYQDHNMPLLEYLGVEFQHADLDSPQLEELYSFGVLKFLLEPCAILMLTLLELSLI